MVGWISSWLAVRRAGAVMDRRVSGQIGGQVGGLTDDRVAGY